MGPWGEDQAGQSFPGKEPRWVPRLAVGLVGREDPPLWQEALVLPQGEAEEGTGPGIRERF